MEIKEASFIFEKTHALKNGHFQLTSGLHSPTYFQCAQTLQYPEYLEMFCREIVEYHQAEGDLIDVVVAPAIGGIVAGQEVARQLGVKSIFAERVDGKMTFRRGFTINPDDNVLIVEDVITTGGTVKELFEMIEETGAYVIGIATIVDRSAGNHVLEEIPLFAAYTAKVITYPPDNCPLCKQNIPITQPGSRNLKKYK